MATPYYNLRTPDDNTSVDVADLVYNFEEIDTAMHNLDTGTLKKTGSQSMAGPLAVTDDTQSTSTSTGALKVSGGIGCSKDIYANKVYNAVWNDYAECRETDAKGGGVCVREAGGKMVVTTERLMPGCKLTSDTYGFCMGETKAAKTPIAVAGRVLAMPYRDKYEYPLGAAVCSGPGGTVDLMTREEIMMYPERIVGTVSEIPDYDVWIGGTEEDPKEVIVRGRIWIYVR